MNLKFSKIRDVKSPLYSTVGSAGIDIFMPNDSKKIKIEPGQTTLIPSGLKFNIPPNYVLVAFNRSSIASKKMLIVGACVGPDTYIKTNKGLFKVIDLTLEFVKNNKIKIFSYDIKNNEYNYQNFDGFRFSNEINTYKITFEDDSEIIVSENHLILDSENKYISVSNLIENFNSISIKQAHS